MARFDGPQRDEPLLAFLRANYSNQRPDLLVPIGAQAAMFCVRHRDNLFTKTPILMLAVDKRRREGLIDASAVASVGLDLDIDGQFKNILQVIPKTEHIYIVMGTPPLARVWEDILRREWAISRSE